VFYILQDFDVILQEQKEKLMVEKEEK